MSNNSHHRFTRLEDFPNELLFDLFEQYISISDLKYGWVGLNQRINFILKSIQLSASTSSSTDQMLHFFKDQIYSIAVSYSCTSSFTDFPNLRSLSFQHASNKHLSDIQSNFILSNIVHLRMELSPNMLAKTSTQFLETLFSNKFSSLRKLCILNEFDFSNSIKFNSWAGSISLRSINIIISNNLHIYSALLIACPNLVRLHLTVSFIDRNSLTTFHHTNLKHLQLRLNTSDWSFDMFEQFLICVPNLQRLVLQRFIWNIEKFNLNLENIRFIRILNQCLTYLHRFDCDILFHSRVNTIDINNLRQLHSCFTRIQIERKNEIDRLYTNN
ncbi:unnamed protein product [Rotaria sordida]|uniref:F-box domain-containing protein n=1 Tax=Rotaria sordida TaxID=392033 RepID=A0A814YXF2_9BILA|nr:unnamed protein product [Rotaria sordida]CAF1516326.1 unnamed protein product [Rotaria sordida]